MEEALEIQEEITGIRGEISGNGAGSFGNGRHNHHIRSYRLSMHYPLRLFFAMSALLCCVAPKAQNHDPGLEFKPLTKHLTVFTSWGIPYKDPYPANGLYLVTANGVVIFDTPWDSTQFQPLLDSIERREHRKVLYCISTHFHPDRTAGLAYYRAKGIKTFTSQKTDSFSVIKGEKRAQYLFATDTVFHVGNETFRIFFPGEGHTKDNLVVWFEKDRTLFGGCLIKDSSARDLGYTGDANLKAWPATIRNLQKTFPHARIVVPGHFGWRGDPVQHTLYLLQEAAGK